MIWRWLICFSVSLSLCSAAGVAGEVELTNSKDAAVRKHKDYAGVVLWLEPVDRAAAPLPQRHVEMQQRVQAMLRDRPSSRTLCACWGRGRGLHMNA